MLAAASAFYADGATGIDPEAQSGSGWLDDSTAIDLFAKAVQRITGAQADVSGKLTIGGVQEINGGYVSLPSGVSAKAVEDTLDSLDYQLRGQRRGPNGWDSSIATTPPDILRAFRAASVDGRVPDLGSNPSARLAGMQMQRVYTKEGEETDHYAFVRYENGRAYSLKDTKGVEVRFRLPALIREAGKVDPDAIAKVASENAKTTEQAIAVEQTFTEQNKQYEATAKAAADAAKANEADAKAAEAAEQANRNSKTTAHIEARQAEFEQKRDNKKRDGEIADLMRRERSLTKAEATELYDVRAYMKANGVSASEARKRISAEREAAK